MTTRSDHAWTVARHHPPHLSGTIGSISSLRGTWIRVVTRLKLAENTGAFEVWVNGKKLVRRRAVTEYRRLHSQVTVRRAGIKRGRYVLEFV